jgi:glutamine amidotransferase-like uncharacterized protein
MKSTQHYIVLLLTCCLFNATAHAAPRMALIYNGVSTCDGCPEAIGAVAKQAHLSVQYISNPQKIPGLLNKTAIFIIGGTDDNIEPMQHAFNKKVIAAIKNYVSKGGVYLGICGGAYIAADYYVSDNVKIKGFQLAPVTAVDDNTSDKARLEKIRWLDKNVVLYFQSGPTFIPNTNSNTLNIIARYQNNQIAAFTNTYGKGRVALIGPHPEADKTWLAEDGIPSVDWQPQQRLLLDLMNQLLKKIT